MDFGEINKLYREIVANTLNFRLYNVFVLLLKMVRESGKADFTVRYETHFSTYQNMLKYSFEFNDDPEKENVHKRLLREILKLTDDIREDIYYKKRLFRFYQYKDQLNKYFKIDEGEPSALIDSLVFQKEMEKILEEANLGAASNQSSEPNVLKSRIDNIFKYIWLTDTLHQADLELAQNIFLSNKLQWHDKCMITSAITLSMLRFFDENKVILLIDLVEKQEDQVWQRAFAGLMVILNFYDKRIFLYPEISNRLKILQDTDDFQVHAEIFWIQYIWQVESEKIAKRINDEILPDVMKIKSMIEEKLDLDNIVQVKGLQDKNPDWEEYFKDSPDLYKKFEEISRLQNEGADIFMGAFAYLKNIPFFSEISNWFVPFYPGNDMIREVKRDLNDTPGIQKIIDGIASSYFLCNSDKYSFCYNLKQVFSAQNHKMGEMLRSELEAMEEMADDQEKLNINIRNKSIFRQYLQDLYRFYALYPGKNEFENIFLLPNMLYKSAFIKEFSVKTHLLHKIGELYFNNNFYEKALDVFLFAPSDDNCMLLEKIAYCYQKTGKYQEAIEYYNKAMLYDKNSNWITYQLAFCHSKSGNHSEALGYNLQLEKIDPDNMNLLADIGRCYLELEAYEDAVRYYFKVEYMAPENHRVQRPIAWCSFMLGKFDVAKKYFEKIILKENNKNDLLNLAHVYWCAGDRQKGVALYIKAFKASGANLVWFDKVMAEDSKHLVKHGIDSFDITLVCDYVKIKNAD